MGLPRIVVCVVGGWANAAELREALARTGAYRLNDGEPRLLERADTGESWPIKVQVVPHPDMARAFRAAAPDLDDAEIEEIAAHRSYVYVVSPAYRPRAAAEIAHRVLHVGTALLDAGGIAIKSESSGIGHGAGQWRALNQVVDDAFRATIAALDSGESTLDARARFWQGLFHTFVRGPLRDGDQWFTCGMHLLGVQDVLTTHDLSRAEATLLVEVFANYLLAESQVAEDHTFRVIEGGRRWRLEHARCDRYPPEDPYYNPWGYWRLLRMDP